jgi:hypothetical protein
MKIKLVYPKIPDALDCPLKQCVAFEKLDGTNLHFVWSPEVNKFTDFGTRRDRFPYSDVGFIQFHQAHPGMEGLKKVIERDILPISTYLSGECVVFAEFIGANSFAGTHQPKDEKKLVIFDVEWNGRLIPPADFIQYYGDLSIPKSIFQGKFTGQLFMDVRNGKYDVKEGVVVKGMVDGQVHMVKIKTQAYLDKLKEKFKDDWKEYGE